MPTPEPLLTLRECAAALGLAEFTLRDRLRRASQRGKRVPVAGERRNPKGVIGNVTKLYRLADVRRAVDATH